MARGPETSHARAIAATIVLFGVVLVSCSAAPRSALFALRPTEICVGPIDRCERDDARFDPLLEDGDLMSYARPDVVLEDAAVTLAYPLPEVESLYLEGAANRHLVRTRAGTVAVQDAGLPLARTGVVPSSRGAMLVEVRLGSHRGLFAKTLLAGSALEIARFCGAKLAGPIAVVGWLALATLQQFVARRQRAQRAGALSLAVLAASTALRILSLQNGYTSLWLDSGAWRRTLEIVTPVGMAFGAAGFYHWLVGARLRAWPTLTWLAFGGGCVVVSLLSVVMPELRPYAVPFLMAFSVWGLVHVVRIIAAGWTTIAREDQRLVLVGAVAIALGAAGDVVMTRFDVDYFLEIGLMPIGLIVETVCQALILARRNERVLEDVARLEKVAREAAEHARIEQERVTDRIRRLDRVKDEFLANTSHELRTPLYSILGLSEAVLGAERSISPASRERLEVVVSSAHRLTALVNDLLDFSKLNHRAIVLDLTDVDLRGAVQRSIAVVAPLADASALELRAAIAPDLVVRADENRLQQILANLLGNAVKFTERGEIVVSAERSAGRVVLAVRDTGIGIAADVRDRIFESFEQGDGSSVRTYGGTGLGLAVTKRLVELHGGRVRVESTLGVGSTFRVDFEDARCADARSPRGR